MPDHGDIFRQLIFSLRDAIQDCRNLRNAVLAETKTDCFRQSGKIEAVMHQKYVNRLAVESVPEQSNVTPDILLGQGRRLQVAIRVQEMRL